MNIEIIDLTENERERAIADMLAVNKSSMYINEKKYMVGLIDRLYSIGYYKKRKTLFTEEF